MLSLQEFRQRARARYEKQRAVADRNRLKYGRDSRESGVMFKRARFRSQPWYVTRPRAEGRKDPYFSTEREAITFHRMQAYYTAQEKSAVGNSAKTTRTTSGYRGCYQHRKADDRLCWMAAINSESNKSSKRFPLTAAGLLAAALWYDEHARALHGKFAVPNFHPDGCRNPNSMTRADSILWTKREYVEPILSLSAAEKKELVALLAAKDVPVPAYLKPKKKKRPPVKVA